MEANFAWSVTRFLASPILSAFVWMYRRCSTWVNTIIITSFEFTYLHFRIWHLGRERISRRTIPIDLSRSKIHKRTSGEKILTSDLRLNISEDACIGRITMIADATIRSMLSNGRRVMRLCDISPSKTEDDLGFGGRFLIAGSSYPLRILESCRGLLGRKCSKQIEFLSWCEETFLAQQPHTYILGCESHLSRLCRKREIWY